MTDPDDRVPPAWMARFLKALPGCESLRAAARAADVPISTVCYRRDRYPAFRAQIEAYLPAVGGAKPNWGGARRTGSPKLTRFLAALGETSNVTAAATAAGVKIGQIYRRRRTDPDFARRWYAALAEGYDNLEMELLQRLRSGEPDSGNPPPKTAGRKFDTATALRCLNAHRESVAREKGRRTLADEVVTIAAINAKIDRLRLNGKAAAKAIVSARKDIAARSKGGADGEQNDGA